MIKKFNTKGKQFTKEKVKLKPIAKKYKVRDKIHSNLIKSILQKKGMSQQELADICLAGDKAYLSKIINGKRKNISLPLALKIAKALNTTTEKLFILKTYEEHEKN